MKCNPWRWLWGLIPILMLSWLAILGERERIEKDLTERVNAVLKRDGQDWAKVAFNGRDGSIAGRALDDGEPPKALQQVLSTWGVRIADNKATLVEKVDNFVWSATRREKSIQLGGYVPSEKARGDVVALAKSSFPGFDVTDGMKLARGAPPADVWLNGVGFGMKQLTQLKQGQVDLEQTNITVAGEAIDAKTYRDVKTALAGGLPQGIRLKQEAVKGPLIKPYVWTAAYAGEQLTLKGHVPSDKARDDIVAAAKRALPKARIVDQLQPGDGAPANFLGAATGLLAQFASLEEGTAEIRDAAMSISGMAPGATQAETVRGALKTATFTGFRATEQIKHREPQIKAISPYVTSFALDGPALILSGYVPSEEVRSATVAVASQRFPGRAIRNELQIAAGQMTGWNKCVDVGLTAMQRLGNGRFALTDRRLEVVGETSNEALAQGLPGEVRSATATDCDSDVRVTLKVELEASRSEASRSETCR